MSDTTTEDAIMYSIEHCDGFDPGQNSRVARVSRVADGYPPIDHVAYNNKRQIPAGFVVDEWHIDLPLQPQEDD